MAPLFFFSVPIGTAVGAGVADSKVTYARSQPSRLNITIAEQ